jgi:hypothetical protein|tara:strand:+ start:2050 stop:2538 length:489 start_codon:yes stop_codon:yes gene_type:complete
MKHLKIFFAVLAMLSASRFIPHPPNFTSLLALSFYIPLVFGSRYILAVIISLLITDMVIGFHSTMFFTLGSVFIIGIISKSFKKTIFSRLSGALSGAIIFFILSNFGVWSQGYYGFTFSGFITCYTMALPFFGYSLVSTFIFSAVIETILKFSKNFIEYSLD